MTDPHSGTFTIGIGGAAGDGVREAGATIGKVLSELGYEVAISFDYGSLIRGGHNYTRVSFSREKLWVDHEKLDILIALTEETVTLHRAELQPRATVFAERFAPEAAQVLGGGALVLPLNETAKNLGAPAIARSSVALGAACYLLDFPLELMLEVLRRVFRDKRLESNIQLAAAGYEHLRALNFHHHKRIESPGVKKEVVDGNTAFARGLVAAGLDFYLGYPMTPATSILHYLAKTTPETRVRVIQPESELAVINMALGVAYAGKRAAVGSASGGFALMQEAFSFAGLAELPLVVAVSQRQAPATGAPTYSSQSDLRFALHAGHGEFPRIVVAPGDPEEAFRLGARALNLAWQYQVPVIVLLDKILSEHALSSKLDTAGIAVERGKLAADFGAGYQRYQITTDGISPLAFPGTPGVNVKVTSYEHNEEGEAVEDLAAVKAMIDKRFAKQATLRAALAGEETVSVYGDLASETAIIFWGSTKGPVLEAVKYLARAPRLVQVRWLEPFPTEALLSALAGAKKIINVEGNHDGQLGALIREKTGLAMSESILKYDSRPFNPAELTEKFKNLLN